MLFNSFDFAIFLPAVLILYRLMNKSLKAQNTLLLVASYAFYGWWDYKFLSLIFISTVVDYLTGLQLAQSQNKRHRKTLLWLSIIVNIGFLGFFKYYNFFTENFIRAFSLFGTEFNPETLNIILPVGISFYTFQTLSYTIDIYNGKLRPTRDFISFAAFVSFFPQLVAGPIERAKNLLPQFFTKRPLKIEDAKDGLRQMLWGLFKKMVIADNCGFLADEIFSGSDQYSGATLFIGAALFAFQIYGDFSGYSDIAIGTAKLFGFKLMKNFGFPYFSRDIAEFWRRWHISLSSWFRDYVYIPLGGSKTTRLKIVRNIFIVFLVSGFWHGANWTFIAWGAYHAVLFLPLFLLDFNRKNTDIPAAGRAFPSPPEVGKISATFTLTTVGWIFFRAEDITHAFVYLGDMFAGFFDKNSYLQTATFIDEKIGIILPLFIAGLIAAEWPARAGNHALENLERKMSTALRWIFYTLLIFAIGMFMRTEETPFIYFQF